MTTRYQHVIWDWNGTLLDDVGMVVDVMNGILDSRGLPTIGRSRYLDVFDFPVRDYYERLGFDFELEPFESLAKAFVGEYETRWRGCSLRFGATDALASLTAEGISQSVLSASENGRLQGYAAHFGIAESFERLVGIGNTHAASKLEEGRRWMRELDSDPSRVVLIGDTVHDYEVARDLGIDSILVEGGHQPRHRLTATGAPVVDDLGSAAAGILSGSDAGGSCGKQRL